MFRVFGAPVSPNRAADRSKRAPGPAARFHPVASVGRRASGGEMMGTKLVLTAALLSLATPAFAADIIAPAPVKAPVPAAIFTWTGFYIGAHGGGAWSKWTGIDPTDPTAVWTSVTASGGIVGGQIGGNYQIGNVVVGLEGTGAWSSVTLNAGGPFGGGAGFTLSLKNDYIATVAGRFGVAFDRVLLYAKGGAAFTRDKYNANNGLAGALAGSASGSFNRTGWLAGGGVEWMFMPNWSVRAEYNYMGFAAITEQPATSGNLAATPANVKLNIQTGTVGVNYHF
ncbi:porin family protein [Bradyrhizobium sp. LCT2]|nr:porin family protein [Bradyrhizobium sp. LCT2]